MLGGSYATMGALKVLCPATVGSVPGRTQAQNPAKGKDTPMSKAMVAQVRVKTQARHFAFQLIEQIAYWHDDDLGYAYPSVWALANHFRCSERTIQ
jgi:hypothetical protein